MNGKVRDWKRKKFIFVTGLHRSGTSLIHRLIRGHPLVSGFEGTGVPEDEGQHLQTIFPNALSLGGPGKFALHPAAYMDESHPLAKEEVAEELFRQWSRYWDVKKEFLVEKSPPTIIRMRFFQRLFPNTYFIVILRHPIPVSYATQKWAKTSIPRILNHTMRCYALFRQDLPHIRRILVFRYEEFVQHPQLFFNKILDFIGLPYIPVHQSVRQDVNAKYIKRWEKDLRYPWKRWHWKWVARRLEPEANALGYSLQNPSVLEPRDFLFIPEVEKELENHQSKSKKID